MAGFRTFLKSGHAPTLGASFFYFAFSCCIWVMNGAIYAFRTHVLHDQEPSLYGNSTVAMPMTSPYDISIDTLEDWEAAEKALGYHHGS